jgi:hypothetical protein
MKKIITLILLLFVITCKEKPIQKKQGQQARTKQKIEIKAVSLFLLGRVESGNRQIKRGEIVPMENGLKTINQSLIDFQIMGNKLNPIIRLHANTVFKMKAIVTETEVLYKGYLEKGTVLVNMEKMNQNSRFVIQTPTMAAEFRGTKVLVTADEQGNTRAKLTEGSLAIKMNIPIIDAISEVLPDEALSKQLNQELKDVEVVLEPGQEVIISKADTEKVIREKKLETFINSPEISAIVNAGIEEEDKVLAVIDTFKNKNPEHNTKEEDSKPMIRESIKLLGLVEKEKEKLNKEFIELKGIQRDKISTLDESTAKKEADSYLKENRKEMVGRIEISLGKKSEGVTLQNDRRIDGVIFQLHDKLKIITPEGEMVIPMSDVKSFAF